MLQDVRYALRHLRRAPGFAAAAILTLAFGIGANTAIFTVLNALVLQRLPIPDPGGFVSFTSRNARGTQRYVPIPAVAELTREGPLEDVCGYNGGLYISVDGNATPTQAIAAFVTGRCFNAFGVTPILGRAIGDEDAPLYGRGNRIAVISHRFWTRIFGADPSVLGRRIRTEGIELTIVGVLPRGFAGIHTDTGTDIFAPFDTVFPAPANRRPVAQQILGRLRDGTTFEQAAAEMTARWPAVLAATAPVALPQAESADLFGEIPHLERMGTGVSGYRDRYARPLTLILGLTVLLLALACVNLGGLLLTRLTARQTEISVRLALGGSRRRIAQQMLVESLALSLCGAALAVPLSFAFIGPLVAFIPAGYVEPAMTFSPDARVLAATAVAAIVVAVLMSAVPTAIAIRQRTISGFVSDRTIAGATSRWARALVVVQVALSVVMLAGAGLLIRSLYLLQRVPLGVHTRGIVNVKAMPVPNGYLGIDNASYYPALLERIAALPGVTSVGFARSFPRATAETFTGQPIGFVGEPPTTMRAIMEIASPGLFETLGVPLLAGRHVSWSDAADRRPVAVVSESLAKALAPDGDILQRRIHYGVAQSSQDILIVGVVGNLTQGSPRLAAPPVVYRPALQVGPIPMYPNLVIAANGGVAAVAAGVRQILHDGGREYPLEIVSLDDVFARAPSSERMSAALAGAVGGLAMLLAVVGAHGTLAYMVSRRRREIGVRVAIGAAPAAMARMVIREGMALTLGGLTIGLPLALLAVRALKSLMFGVSETDPLTFSAITLLFVAIGLASGIAPARRAARVDPALALRAD